ncbi:sulfate adenylyltransferase [Candidatus Woesearchaeota archaeon CG10_big_fil_rev_8_21_14_0_10_45_16]|nr:MAG: sulfate adenylyltransferase [Candidatus Woesearchaeota archaeon CG10_big_fil_rev_8_21_14_0_10_45_16]
MATLKDLEEKSIFIIREVYSRFKKPAILWSIGKDSTTLLWLIRKAFYGEIPFPVVHIDTTFKFPEMYAMRDRLAKGWGFNLIVEKNEDALERGIGYSTHDAFTCCDELKTKALKKAVEKHGFDAVLVGIRRDEHGIRNKERYFSPRDSNFGWNVVKEKEIKEGDSNFVSLQDAELDGFGVYATEFTEGTSHVRVHPLLHWTELDIWEYALQEKLPICSLYFAKDGQRYRSLGCQPITEPISSQADTVEKIIEELKQSKSKERDGRRQDKETEHMMQKLRSLGYM